MYCQSYHLHQRLNHVLLALLVAVSLAPCMSAGRVQAQSSNVFDVNSTDDRVDSDPGDGVCAASAGSATTCTLRAAIMEANVLGGRQTIRVAPGRYDLTIEGTDENGARTGDLDIAGDVTIRALEANNRPIIDAKGRDRVFDIRGGAQSVSLSDLIIRGGDATKSRFVQDGGAIGISTNVNLSIVRSLITDNRAERGGAFEIFGGSLNLSSSQITNNQASEGSGAFQTAVTTHIRNSVISGNQGDFVGGFRIFAFTGTEVRATIESSTISNNTGRAGGLFIDKGNNDQLSVSMTNVTVSGNTGISVGNRNDIPPTGGIAMVGPNGVSLQNVTIARNSGVVGGVFAEDTFGSSSSIIANNSGGDCRTERSIPGFTNLAGDLSCHFSITVGNQRNVNPLLGPLALNGATNGTRTHALLSGSPALGSADNSSCPSRDQRGIRRPQGSTCDKGAFEQVINVQLGTAALAPSQVLATAQQTTTLTLSWTVPPTKTWRDLRTIDFQLDAGEMQPLIVRFNEGVTFTEVLTDTGEPGVSQEITPTDTLTLFDAGSEVGTGVLGDAAVLEGDNTVLDLAQSRLQTDGPEGKTVTLTLALRFKQPLAGKHYAVTLVATNDAGELQGPESVGELAVGPFSIFLPLVMRP